MLREKVETPYHLSVPEWCYTQSGEMRGFIQPQKISELWFHTGTNCNLQCPFCFEGSSPGNKRLLAPTLEDVLPFLEEAKKFNVQKIAFTGGEPFVNAHITDILDAALDVAPCLVLTNGTTPLHKAISRLAPFKQSVHPLSFRISLDSPYPWEHDKNRGLGSFDKALDGLVKLHELGFHVSVARQFVSEKNEKTVNEAYATQFVRKSLPASLPFVSFPDLLAPNATPDVPNISEQCMTLYKTQEDREKFMCNYSKMVVKQHNGMRVYACTLVDDDPDYALASTLEQAMLYRVMLRHHRCYSCFTSGTACGGI